MVLSFLWHGTSCPFGPFPTFVEKKTPPLSLYVLFSSSLNLPPSPGKNPLSNRPHWFIFFSFLLWRFAIARTPPWTFPRSSHQNLERFPTMKSENLLNLTSKFYLYPSPPLPMDSSNSREFPFLSPFFNLFGRNFFLFVKS